MEAFRTLRDAAKRPTPGRLTITNDDIGSAVVVEPELSEYIGIGTKTEIMQQVAAGVDINSVRVSTPLVTIASTEDIRAAATLLKEHSIKRLPVTDDGELVGILTTTDLTHYLPRLRNALLRGRDDLAAQ